MTFKAAFVPLLVVGAAGGLWWASDRLGSIGPLDKATFGWLFVVPIWAAAPAITGFAWQDLAASARGRAAMASGVALGAVTALLLWLDVVNADCQLGLDRTPLEFALPALVCGVATGALFAFGLASASAQAAAGRPVRAVGVGAAAQLVLLILMPTIASAAFFGVCARP